MRYSTIVAAKEEWESPQALVLLVFRGVCTEPRHKQCQIDLCYLDAIQNYGAASGNVSKLMGFNLRTCERYREQLNYTAQALAVAQELQRAYPRGGWP